jgi:hypothetical protein
MMLNVMWVGLPHGVCHSTVFFELKPWGKKPPGGLNTSKPKYNKTYSEKTRGSNQGLGTKARKRSKQQRGS